MIYSVECSYSDPASEAEWNDFYSRQKLPALVSVRGFFSSQRFKALSAGCPVYLALHSIEHADVLNSSDYREKGGGNFARWQPYISDWHRNVYDGTPAAPAVSMDQYLVISAVGPAPLLQLGLTPQSLQAVALDRSPAQRWLATLPGSHAPSPAALPPGVYLYAPMAPQLTPAAM